MRPITCSCGECRKCKHRAYMREWYSRHPGYAAASVAARRRERDGDALRAYDRRRYHDDPAHRLKFDARRALGQAVRRGKIKRQPCEVCGALDTEGHHDDYSKPLDVRWLCAAHHIEHHMREHHGQHQLPVVQEPRRGLPPPDVGG